MHHVLGSPTVALCLVLASTAAAQTTSNQLLPPPPPPPPGMLPPSSRPVLQPGSCVGGAHEGIVDADAHEVAAIVCREVRRRAPGSSSIYVVEVRRSGADGTLSVAEVSPEGALLKKRTRRIENIRATYRETPGLVADLLGADPRGKAAPPAKQTKTATRWYGWQTLALDGSAFVALVAPTLLTHERSESRYYPAEALFCLGAPTVHLANGHPWRSVLSLGTRVLVTTAISSGLESPDGVVEALEVVLLGGLAATGIALLDAGPLALESVEPKPAAVQWNVTPAIGRSGGSVFLGGTF